VPTTEAWIYKRGAYRAKCGLKRKRNISLPVRKKKKKQKHVKHKLVHAMCC